LDQKILAKYVKQLNLPASNSRKGQNGNLLVIGGSELFHAACKWSLDIASKIVDMVYFSSTEENNQLIRAVKGQFWNGIVIPRKDMETYIDNVDCILIGPGMDRSKATEDLSNTLLHKYPQNKWVIDAGALQMIDPALLGKTHIITPHLKELERLESKGFSKDKFLGTLLVKGKVDILSSPQFADLEISGGNPGMTKGGTGDVLAGLIAALYCTNDETTATVIGSYINKKAGEKLAEKVGPFFNASDLVDTIPTVLWDVIKKYIGK
jgi:hydroxyethylthiazole kinase-like uncharacterized protein yjeF